MEDSERAITSLLRDERPFPSSAFRGELGRRLKSGPEHHAPRRLPRPSVRALAAAYLGGGLVLLALAAVGLTGAGPFGV